MDDVNNPTQLAPQGVLGEGVGPLGDGGLHPGRANMALVRRAIKNGWNVPEDYKRGIVDQMYLVATCSDDERNQIGAAKVLVAADGADLKLQMGEESPAQAPQGDVHVNVSVTPAIVVQQALQQPSYLTYLESLALAADSNPGPVRPHGGTGAVEDGPAPARGQ